MNVTLTIDGMNCGHCVKAVTEALAALPGVSGLSVEVGRATFRLERAADDAELRRAIEDAGFEVSAVGTSP